MKLLEIHTNAKDVFCVSCYSWVSFVCTIVRNIMYRLTINRQEIRVSKVFPEINAVCWLNFYLMFTFSRRKVLPLIASTLHEVV